MNPSLSRSTRRAVGRIGGVLGSRDHAAVAKLAERLGPGAQILGPRADIDLPVVADWDACWVKGYPVRTLADWRAIVAAGALAKVEGAFAVAWIDVDGTLSLARDALGRRTLYYARAGDAVLFASSIHAVVASGVVDRSINLSSLAAYLAYGYVPGRETLLAGVQQVAPGEVVGIRHPHVSRSRFWNPPSGVDARWEPGEDEVVGMLRMRLDDAVHRCLPAGAPVGALLSSGVDSSIIVALTRRLHDHAVVTLSASFDRRRSVDVAQARTVAQHFGTEHRVVHITPALVRESLDGAIALLNEPMADPLTVVTAVLFKDAARDVGVVLTGDGGDPCFGGPSTLSLLRDELGDESDGEGPGPSRERGYLGVRRTWDDDLDTMLMPEAHAALADDVRNALLANQFRDPSWATFIARLTARNATFKSGHHVLSTIDALSAGAGVLARSPLFDRAIVETAFAIPSRLSMRRGVPKYVLKRAVRDLVPRAILDAPRLARPAPLLAWIDGPLRGDTRERLIDGLAPYRLFEPKYLERLVGHRRRWRRSPRVAKLWMLVTLEAWLRSVFS